MNNTQRALGPIEPSASIASMSQSNQPAAAIPPGCAACPAHDLTICEARRGDRPAVHQSAHKAPPRRVICREREFAQSVPVICEGWACCAVMLGDGTRQIFSFLLAGEAVASSLFGPRPDCFIETITPVTYRLFDRAAVRDLIFASPAAIDTIGRVRMEDQWRTDALIVDLARRPADERIARLILDLRTRLQRRGLVQGYPPAFEFPLRLHHIADALGLTPVHVSKVLSDLRRRKLISLNGRTLTLIDPAGLARIAQMR